MKKYKFIGSLLLVGCTALPAGSGRIVHQARTVPAFTEVEVRSALHADITAGIAQSLVVSGDDNLVGYVVTHVEDGRLIIGLRDGVQGSNDSLLIRVSTPRVTALAATGSAEVNAGGISAERLELIASGASTLTVEGGAALLDANASGASEIRARSLTTSDAVVEASGASSAVVCAQDSLDLHLSGASDAVYACHPKNVTSDVTGASTARAE